MTYKDLQDFQITPKAYPKGLQRSYTEWYLEVHPVPLFSVHIQYFQTIVPLFNNWTTVQ